MTFFRLAFWKSCHKCIAAFYDIVFPLSELPQYHMIRLCVSGKRRAEVRTNWKQVVFLLLSSTLVKEKKIGCTFLFGCEKVNCLGYAGQLLTLSILLMANLASVNHEDSDSLLDIYWFTTNSFLCGYRMRRYCWFFWMWTTYRYLCMVWWKVCYCLLYLLLF